MLLGFVPPGVALAGEGFLTSLSVMALTNSTKQGGQGSSNSTILTETELTYHGSFWGVGGSQRPGRGRSLRKQYRAVGQIRRGRHGRGRQSRRRRATALQSPLGIAVDPVGNVYVIEQASGRLVLVTTDGKRFSWVTGFLDPQYVALTQY